MYAHFGAFVVHQMCNGRFNGPGPFEKFTGIHILDNIEKPFSITLVKELLRQFKYDPYPDFRYLTVEDINDLFEDFCEEYPECCS